MTVSQACPGRVTDAARRSGEALPDLTLADQALDTRSGAGESVSSVTDLSVFNEKELLRRLMNDRPLASSVIGGFLCNAPSQLQNLSTRLKERDAPGVRQQAHALKGAAATVSAAALRAAAAAIEQAAKANDLGLAGEFLPQANHQLERLARAVEDSGLM